MHSDWCAVNGVVKAVHPITALFCKLAACFSEASVQSYLCNGICQHQSCALQIRALLKKREASKYGAKVSAKAQRREHQQQHQLPHDDLADVFK